MSKAPTSTFGDLLRRYRKATGLSQEELAERAHLSPRTLSDLERGVASRPYRDTVLLLAEALELAGPERDVLERAIEAARASLGEQVAAAAWVEGQAMTLEQAVAYALEAG